MSEVAEATPKKLTAKQRAFINEYVIDLNGTQAAIRAGYSADTAQAIASENLSKPFIADAIQEALDLRAERTRITADRVLVESAKLGFSNIRNLFTDGGQLKSVASMTEDEAAGIQSIEVVTKRMPGGEPEDVEYVSKIRLVDKKASLELLGKHLRLFSDKIEVTGKDGKTREQRQIAALKRMKIPFHESAIGRPKVSRAVINGGVEVKQSSSWEPSLA